MTLMGENDYGQAPSQSELMGWAQSYGLTHPVLQDNGFYVGWNYISTESSGSFNLPNMQLLSPGMEIEIVNGWVSSGDISNHVPN
jgi:hypothetical protein